MLAEGWPDDGGDRRMIPPPAWAGMGLDVEAGRAEGGGRAWAGLRFRPAAAQAALMAAPAAAPAAPSRPARGRPRRGEDDLSLAEGRAAYLAWCRRIKRDPRDPDARSPSWQEVWSKFRGLMKRETIRAIHQQAWGPKASEKGRKGGPA